MGKPRSLVEDLDLAHHHSQTREFLIDLPQECLPAELLADK